MMKMMNWTDPTSADKALERGEQEDTVIVRDGHAVALVTPFDDDDVDWYARERDPSFLKSIEQARADIAAGKGITHEKLKRKLG